MIKDYITAITYIFGFINAAIIYARVSVDTLFDDTDETLTKIKVPTIITIICWTWLFLKIKEQL